MGNVESRNCQVTITVFDTRSEERYANRAFPTGQGPGRFSAPVSVGRAIHWVYVTVEAERAHVVGGTKVSGDAFKLAADHDEWMGLVQGCGSLEYDLKARYVITVEVALRSKKLGEARPDRTTAEAMSEILERPTPRAKPRRSPKTRSAGQVRSLMRALGIR